MDMHPIYFPFTYIPGPVAEVLATWFSRITVLSPSKKEIDTTMRDLASQEWLSILTPFDGDDAALDEVVKSYREWANLHGGRQLKPFMAQGRQTPFYDDSSVYHLLDEIQSHSRGTGAAERKSGQPDNRHLSAEIQKSRILLLIAQELDRRNWEIQQDLARVASIERDFWKQLHATDDVAKLYSSRPVLSPEGGYSSYMLRERLEAWTCFLLQEKMLSSRVFVTTSELIVDRFIQVLPSTAPLLSIHKVPIHRTFDRDSGDPIAGKWRDELAHWLADQTMSVETNELKAPPVPPRAQKDEPATSLNVYRSPQPPLQWFGRAAGINDQYVDEDQIPFTGQATLLVFVSKDRV
jgi:hypothetical protein